MTSLFDLTATTPNLPCRTTDPELFFSKSSSDRARAVALCAGCPIKQACAQYALDDRDLKGVWGGTTAADRRSFQSGRPWRFDEEGRLRLECGSEDAYRAHFGYREPPCGACVAAHEALMAAERRARLAVEHAAGGSSKGFWIHRSLGEGPCDECRARWGQRQRTAARRRAAPGGRTRARAASGTPGAAATRRDALAGVQSLAIAS